MRGLRVAVTGASGFCGAVVARAAADAGAEVVCVGRRPGPVGQHVYWDAAVSVADLACVDAVVHCAAAVGDRGAEAWFRAVNVDGTARLLDALDGRPLVWVSSASVYRPGQRGPLAEDAEVGGQLTAYGRTKAEGERLALAAGAVVVRPRAVYGPGDPHLLPRLRRAVRAGVLPLPGGDVPLSLTAVENLADACLAALGWPAGAYNVADAAPYRRDEALRQVLEPVHGGVRIVHVPVGVVRGVAAVLDRLPVRGGGSPRALTRYAVDQLAGGVVLDIGRALATGWRPRRTLADFTSSSVGR